MISLTKTNEIKKHIEKVLQENQKRIKEAIEELSDIKTTTHATKSQLENISVNIDVDSYHKIKEELTELEDKAKNLENKIVMLNSLPLISREEYEALKEAVINEIRTAETEARKKLIVLSEEASAVGIELKEATDKANETLEEIQKELYKSKEPLSYDTFNTCLWAGAGVDALTYKVETNQRPSKGIEKLTNL